MTCFDKSKIMALENTVTYIQDLLSHNNDSTLTKQKGTLYLECFVYPILKRIQNDLAAYYLHSIEVTKTKEELEEEVLNSIISLDRILKKNG